MKYRCSESVWLFGTKIEKSWGLKKWTGHKDPDDDVLFFGMYEIGDYQVLNNHNGKRTIFWCGGDVPRIYLNPERKRIATDPNIEHWVETKALADELLPAGIKAHIAPSFLEKIDEFSLSYKYSNKPHIWLSGHPKREEEYGFNLAKKMAIRFPEMTFHLYGIDKQDTKGECSKNVIYHGWVSSKQLDEEIKDYQGCIRANQHDGNSEVPMKAMLLGQYAITYLPYDFAWQFKTDDDVAELLERLAETKVPNTAGRNYWRTNLNQYPWTQ